MPTQLATLTDARGEPLGEWTSEPTPGTHGRWVRLVVVRANEWSPAVRAGREEEVPRAIWNWPCPAASRPAARGTRCGS